MNRAEKICRRHTGPKERKHLKHKVVKARRRAEKTDPENAPTRIRHFFYGWSD